MRRENEPAAAPQPHALPHNLILENRSRLTVSGVTKVLRCDENGAAMETGSGTLLVTGEGLSMSELSMETGEVHVGGSIDSLAYEENRPSSGSLWQRLFR